MLMQISGEVSYDTFVHPCCHEVPLPHKDLMTYQVRTNTCFDTFFFSPTSSRDHTLPGG